MEEIIKDDDDSLDSNFMEERTLIPNERSLYAQMQLNRREDHEKQFQDEVEYEPTVQVREKYKDYKYMKSFLQHDWNKFD